MRAMWPGMRDPSDMTVLHGVTGYTAGGNLSANMNSILGIFAYAPTNLRIACYFFIHESWLFCVCRITPDYLYHISLTPV